jgi:hypothetical protein
MRRPRNAVGSALAEGGPITQAGAIRLPIGASSHVDGGPILYAASIASIGLLQ